MNIHLMSHLYLFDCVTVISACIVSCQLLLCQTEFTVLFSVCFTSELFLALQICLPLIDVSPFLQVWSEFLLQFSVILNVFDGQEVGHLLPVSEGLQTVTEDNVLKRRITSALKRQKISRQINLFYLLAALVCVVDVPAWLWCVSHYL